MTFPQRDKSSTKHERCLCLNPFSLLSHTVIGTLIPDQVSYLSTYILRYRRELSLHKLYRYFVLFALKLITCSYLCEIGLMFNTMSILGTGKCSSQWVIFGIICIFHRLQPGYFGPCSFCRSWKTMLKCIIITL